MRTHRPPRAAIAMLALLLAQPALADCKPDGTIDRWEDRSGFTLYPRSGDRQYAVWLRGEMLAPADDSRFVSVWVDAIRYRFVPVPVADIVAAAVAAGADPDEVHKDDATLLQWHARLVFDEGVRAGSALTVFEDGGVYARPDVGVHEAATFRRWRMHDAGDRAADVYSTVVVGDEVLVMLAVVEATADAGAKGRVERVMRHHADALDWQDCAVARD